jgi:hypothetical protein
MSDLGFSEVRGFGLGPDSLRLRQSEVADAIVRKASLRATILCAFAASRGVQMLLHDAAPTPSIVLQPLPL